MSAREIVTLQVGNYSNFVGTHWWNLQEQSFIYDPAQLATFPKEVNHDVLFREGKTTTGQVTYTPRLVLFDLNHSLGSLKREGILYCEDGEESVNWIGDVTLHEAPRERKNVFLEDLDETQINSEDYEESKALDAGDIAMAERSKETETPQVKQEDPVFGKPVYNLNNEVKVWSDYLRTALHPRTIHIIQEYQHNNPEQSFDVFGLGQKAVGDKTHWDQLEDRIRFFTEECDYLQGFQILMDCYDGFGGMGTSILTYLSDEYSSKSRFTCAVTPSDLPDKTARDRSCRIINHALSLHHGCEQSSLYLPLSVASSLWKAIGGPRKMGHLDYKAELRYHSSAVLAASLDTMTMPYRQETGPARLSHITSSFSSFGRKVACLSSSLPYPLQVGGSFPESLVDVSPADLMVSLTPHVTSQTSPFFQSCVVRGIADSMVKRPMAADGSHSLLSNCSSVAEVLRLYLAEMYPRSMNAGCVMRNGLQVGSPFPHIFSPFVNHKGFLSDTQRSASSGVYSTPAMTSLQSNSDIHQHIASLQACTSQFNIKRHAHFLDAGLEEDDYTEMLEGLSSLAQCYDDDGGIS